MKKFLMLLCGTVIVLGMDAAAASAFEAGPSYCYECAQVNPNYFDCYHPVQSGHKSCVPYATGCMVGAQCGQALQQFRITPDGSYLNSMLLDVELAQDAAADAGQLHLAGDLGEETVKNCLGLVAARHYSPTRALEIETATASLTL